MTDRVHVIDKRLATIPALACIVRLPAGCADDAAKADANAKGMALQRDNGERVQRL